MYSLFQNIKDGACAQWIKNSHWAKYLMLISIIVGVLSGSTITGVYMRYLEVSKPKIVHVDNVYIVQSARQLVTTITNSYSPNCDKVTYHLLTAVEKQKSDSPDFYSLTPGIGGYSYHTSGRHYTVHLNIPEYVPNGAYNYSVRSLYFCNLYGLSVYYPSETEPVLLHLN